MRKAFKILSTLLIVLSSCALKPNLYGQIITTMAGTGAAGYTGDGGQATAATLRNPGGVCVDASGNVYICDQQNNVIRKVTTSGIISTIAGTGTPGFSGDGGFATAAELNKPLCITIDATGNLFFSDEGNNRVRTIVGSLIATVAGNGTASSTGDGGTATTASINNPYGVTLDASENLYIMDGGTKVRVVSAATGDISTYAGNGTGGFSGDGGAATAAEMYQANCIYMDGSNNLYISDNGNQRIRVVNSSGIINTAVGTGTAGFSGDGGQATAAEIRFPAGITKDAS